MLAGAARRTANTSEHGVNHWSQLPSTRRMSLRVFGLTYFISTVSIRCESGQAGQASGQWSVRRKTAAGNWRETSVRGWNSIYTGKNSRKWYMCQYIL